MRPVLTASVAVLILAGCAGGFSGLGGSSKYGCQAPKGSACNSISGVYANGPQGPRIAVSTGAKPLPVQPYGAVTNTSPSPAAAGSGADPGEPLRTRPRVLRLWIAPWEDSDGDLHEESTVHVLVDTGRWRVPHVRPAPKPPQDVKAPVPPAPAPPAKPAAGSSTPAARR